MSHKSLIMLICAYLADANNAHFLHLNVEFKRAPESWSLRVKNSLAPINLGLNLHLIGSSLTHAAPYSVS